MNNTTPVVAIIGGGFSGMLTAAHLLREAESPLKVTVINAEASFGRGIAFDPYSDLHLLNVMAGNMSAFPDDPDHFVGWILAHANYGGLEKDLVSKSYLPRSLYGQYLDYVWEQALRNNSGNVEMELLLDFVEDIEPNADFLLRLKSGKTVVADYVVLATGNSDPGKPAIRNNNFYRSENYHADPWRPSTVQNLRSEHDILIIGNGLTMVDTVLGLREAGFTKNIYSISPHGFSILQHRHNGLSYPSMMGQLRAPYRLRGLVNLFNKHRKAIRRLGLSAEPVIDSLRPVTQTVWMALSVEEKKSFMRRLRHMWGVARHRLPVHVHDLIVGMKLDGNLMVRAGKIIDIDESPAGIHVDFYNKKTGINEVITVERVINCTGPESDISRSSNALLRNLWKRGLLISDSLALGAMADPVTYEALDDKGKVIDSIFLIGSILRGLLWESTAVPEIRSQAQKISEHILNRSRRLTLSGILPQSRVRLY